MLCFTFLTINGAGKTFRNNLENLKLSISHEKPPFLFEIVSENKSKFVIHEYISYNKTIKNEDNYDFIQKTNIEYLYLNVKRIIQSINMYRQQNKKNPFFTPKKKRTLSYYLNIPALDLYLTKFCDILRIKIKKFQKTINYQHLYFIIIYPVYEFYIRIYQKMKKLNHWIYILSFRHAVFLCLF